VGFLETPLWGKKNPHKALGFHTKGFIFLGSPPPALKKSPPQRVKILDPGEFFAVHSPNTLLVGGKSFNGPFPTILNVRKLGPSQGLE